MMSTNSKNILVFTDWFLPGYKAGGPIRSLANLVDTLQDITFYIVTRNTDHFSTEPYKDIVPNTWHKHGNNCMVFYFDERSINLRALKKIIKETDCDKVYLNSLFSPKFTLLPLIALRQLKLQNKCVLAPRGMLKPGALSVKAGKKKGFLRLSKLIGLFNGIIWHATSNEEVSEIKTHFPKAAQIKLAPNIASVIGEKPKKPNKQMGELKLVCIARISAEKGIAEALSYLKDANLNGRVVLDFYGTIQDKTFLEECTRFASGIQGALISFKGEVIPDEIPSILKQYHFFYLATLGENFGHAIAESLNNATPVIVSNRTPWRNLSEKGAGWDLPLESSAFYSVLNECLSMENLQYQKMCEAAFALAKEVANDKTVLQMQYELFDYQT